MASATYPNKSGATPQSPQLAELQADFDNVDDTALLARLALYRINGRPGYPLRPLLRAYLAGYCLGLPSANALIRQLQDNPQLRELCGFGDQLPVRRTFNRFIKRLNDHPDLVGAVIAGVAERFKEFLPDFGEAVAIDSTAIHSHCNPNRKPVSDPEASWSVKHSVKSGKDGTEWFFGYNLQMVVDARYGIPLAQHVTTGCRNDSPELPPLVERAKAQYEWFQPAVAIADRGYDAASNHQYLYQQGIAPVIHIRRPGNKSGLYQDIYTKEGVPTCLGQVPMEYARTDERGHHLYRCRREGCHLRDSTKGGVPHCDTEYWQDPAEDIRLFGVIRRQSREWKEWYGKRWTIEQTFKSLKESRSLDRHYRRGLKSITLHALMSTLSYLVAALVKLQAGQFEDMRWMVRKVA